MGVEIKETGVSDAEFEEMKQFVFEYLAASVEKESEGGRMRWYPWHSAEYRHNHILNVVGLAERIARKEGADIDVTRVAALFHDVAKLEADQELHAEAGARVAREYLQSRGEFPESFVSQVCRAIEQHSYQGDLEDVSLETQCLIEADLLDKIGANGTALMLLRMGYEARTHMESDQMVDRVLDRGLKAANRVESDTAESIAHQRLKRVRWFREWLEEEIAEMGGRETDRP
ncbi:HD domain-containing protein [Halobacteria archaeon AArc-m2/3/4]|uniref:HD domain-containing protein n=1 Tax=Natronoglomus mannanivorans TaxID=2979990 RepID=A0AAP3E1G9_9EURY|nr:HD domain-containing protein [Halobacteria archaeon AArc-xg1-1]MCU4973328.1 HD domain-containing protein [Halobacteria archaeon AArc-m2/3/4]